MKFLLLLVSLGNAFAADKDPREIMDRLGYPFSTFGQIKAKSMCTGTLVASRVVLTAAHCLNLKNGKLDPEKENLFLPVVYKGASDAEKPSEGVEVVTGGWVDEKSPAETDWALMTLKEVPVCRHTGKGFRHLQVAENMVRVKKEINSISYSKEFEGGDSAGIHYGCNVKEIVQPKELFLHECAGGDGGAIVEQAFSPAQNRDTIRIVGLMLNNNKAIDASTFLRKVILLQKAN